MIPDRVAEVLQGPTFLQIGTRDAELRPTHTHVHGALVHDDRRTVTFFVTEKRAKRVVRNLEDNGRIALTGAQPSHECYQVKGVYVSSRPATDEDYAYQEAYEKKTVAALLEFFPEEFARPLSQGYVYRPSVAITFRVDEIYLQTPGPQAGTRMV